MNCPKCKNPNEDNATICEWCGASCKDNAAQNNLSELDREILSLSANKLAAVKLCHKKTGLDLKDAKKYVDDLCAQFALNQTNNKSGCLSLFLVLFSIGTAISIVISFICFF